MDSADLAVIGAGPAGCATAIQCAAAGLRVLLIERELFPRHRPGETLHPGTETLLRQLGVWAEIEALGSLRHEGICVEWGGKRSFQPFGRDADGPWQGLQILRSHLDTLLLERAKADGVQVLQPCRMLAPLVEEGRVIGVVTDRGELRARFVIDASGGSHRLAHALDLPLKRFSPRLIARYGYAVGTCAELAAAPRIVGDGQGWVWTARVGYDLYQWTRLRFNELDTDRGWRPAEFQALTPQGPSRGADVTWRIAEAVAGPGWFLAGDAASVLDPAASHGVLKALMSGLLVADLIRRMLREDLDERAAIRTYTVWTRRLFNHDVARLVGLYAGSVPLHEQTPQHGQGPVAVPE